MKLKKDLVTSELLGNVLIEINDLYGKTTLSIADFAKIASVFYGDKDSDSLLKSLKEGFSLFLYGKVAKLPEISISKDVFDRMKFSYRGCKDYDLHFDKGDIKFELKEKEPSREMRRSYRKILDVLTYDDLNKATQKRFGYSEAILNK